MPRSSSNWPDKIPFGRSVDQPASRPEQDKNWEPRRPGAQAPSANETRFRSRIERRAKKVRLPVQELEQWEVWCAINHLDFQDLVTLAIRDYLSKIGSPGAQEPSHHDLDDQDVDDEADSSSSSLFCEAGRPGTSNAAIAKQNAMLGFYTEKTGNLVRHRDREAYAKVAEIPEQAIRLGIMQSVLLCKTRVNSFSYCIGAIHEAYEAGISFEQVEYMARTFAARMELKSNPQMDEAEYRAKLRAAAQGQQPTLPGAGGELKRLGKGE